MDAGAMAGADSKTAPKLAKLSLELDRKSQFIRLPYTMARRNGVLSRRYRSCCREGTGKITEIPVGSAIASRVKIIKRVAGLAAGSGCRGRRKDVFQKIVRPSISVIAGWMSGDRSLYER